MNRFFRRIKNILYNLPFGLKGADAEIMGAGNASNGGVSISQEVSDERVAKHLLKGEVTKEVEELRYRTYKVERESEKYNYIGSGLAEKKKEKNKNDTIKFSQENKLICEDILSELSRVNDYGIERYRVTIEYSDPVRIKLQEFLTNVDVLIKKGEKAITTLRFDDIMNPSSLRSKPFINEMENLTKLFEKKDFYGLGRNDYVVSVYSMHFVTFNATDEQSSLISYSFYSPELIDAKHENGEYKLVYKWEKYDVDDLTEKFFNAELEGKYRRKERKNIPSQPMEIE